MQSAGLASEGGAPARHAPKPSMSGDWAGFPTEPSHIRQPSASTVRDRQGHGMAPINTNRGVSGPSEMQTPATGYDMYHTPLLPSQLLMGSPFQSGSPATFTPSQFQNFNGFPSHSNLAHQQNHPHPLSSPLGGQQAMSPQLFQNMFSPGPMSATTPSFGQFGQSPTQSGFGGQGFASGTSRTVYLGNIPPDTPAEEILGHVRSGQIESVRLLPDKNCAFISFLDSSSAVHFHSDAILKKLAIRGEDVKIGWGKPSQVPSSVALAVQQAGASRNVYLGNLPPEMTEEQLREELGKFGPIDTIKLVREKNIGFVHFLSIGNAIKAVTQLPQDPNWQPPRRVFYGKDRCAYVSKTQQQNAAQYLGIAPGYAHVLNSADRDLISNALTQQSVAAAAVATAAGGVNNLGNRTVYLGNIHPETTAEEICNVVRGGLLHHVRYIPDKHICFVTFIDPTAAASFYALSNMQGLMIHNRRLKIGWGKHSGALPPAIAMAVSGGASRNVYIGNIDESWTEERLRQDFSEYGEIELVNTLKEKSCAFVNFTNIANAIKAIEAIRGKEEYKRFKINFGKDRCGNAPRQNGHNGQGQQGNNPDGLPSPVNGIPSQNSQGPSSGTRSNFGSSPGPGQQSSSNFAAPPSATQSGHPLNVYLNQVASSEQSSAQAYMQNAGQQQGGSLGAGSPSNPIVTQTVTLEPPSQPNYGHTSSNSYSATGGGLSPTSSNEGLLGANLNAAARGQHNRAVSLPAFTQGPYGQGQQGQPPSADLSGLGADIGALGGGATSPASANSFGLAIQNDSNLRRWPEEEVGSS